MAKKIRFLVKKMDSSKRSETPEKSVNKIQKDIAVEFLNLIGLGRPKEGLRFFTPDCKTHNPYVIGGMDALVDAMIAVQKKGAEGIRKGSPADFKLIVRNVLADGDLCSAYATLKLQSQQRRAEASPSFPFQ